MMAIAFVVVWFFVLTRPDGETVRVGPFQFRELCESVRAMSERNLPGSARYPCVEQHTL
jgi:hypothetical protein